MKVIQFSILINAGRQNVWHTMLDNISYPKWAKAFHDGSYYQGNWDKGSEIRFLGPDENGNSGGMLSKIKENIKYQFISIEHLGIINNGIADTNSEEAKRWVPSYENYTFIEINGQTELKIEMQVAEEYSSMFEEMWPRALKALKALCEK